MTRLILTLPVMALALAACTQAEQNAAIGAIGGAALGAAVTSDKDRGKGVVIGAAVGAAASQLIGPAPRAGDCYYRNSRGERFIAPCQ